MTDTTGQPGQPGHGPAPLKMVAPPLSDQELYDALLDVLTACAALMTTIEDSFNRRCIESKEVLETLFYDTRTEQLSDEQCMLREALVNLLRRGAQRLRPNGGGA